MIKTIIEKLKTIFCTHPDIKVVAYAKNSQQLVEYCPYCRKHRILHYGVMVHTGWRDSPVWTSIKELGGVNNWFVTLKDYVL